MKNEKRKKGKKKRNMKHFTKINYLKKKTIKQNNFKK